MPRVPLFRAGVEVYEELEIEELGKQTRFKKRILFPVGQ
jgi:hypothetical protein